MLITDEDVSQHSAQTRVEERMLEGRKEDGKEKVGLTTDDDDSLKMWQKERERKKGKKRKREIQKACRNVGRGSKRIGGFYLRMCASLVGGSLKCKPCDITNHFWEPCPGPDVGKNEQHRVGEK